MTTTVTIEAHCADDTQVKIEIKENGEPLRQGVLQDGETANEVVYDAISITVSEVPR